PEADRFASIRFLEGNWEGTTDGQSGKGKVKRTYEQVIGDRFLHGRNTSVYDANEKHPKGENHEDRSIFSLDKNRKTIVMRKFHIEGFVNQYTLTSAPEDKKTIVFTTEAIENIASGWRARETYKVVSADEFEETFELAEPGKDFEVYSKATLRRKK
ncbi:MAG: FABP family protein, partial [Planctomycetes bacterium]|nr:FABP family protein [Planctomycetota bacterium]